MKVLSRSSLTVAVAALALASIAHAGPRTIQVKGSDTMVNLGQAWAEELMKRKPEVSIAVTGGGSGTGIAALLNGTCDVAQCSRAMKPKEKEQLKAKGHEAQEFTVAIDALVVAVNPANKVASLTFEQLSDIYTGKVGNWKDVGGEDRPITLLCRERNSGTHVYFLEHVVRKGNDKGPEQYAKTALLLSSSQAVVDEVATNAGAIGYYGLGYLGPKNRALLVAAKAGEKPVGPSVAGAQSGTYPISRPLFLYTAGEPTAETKMFVDFCASRDGQKVVEKLDFVPLPEKGK